MPAPSRREFVASCAALVSIPLLASGQEPAKPAGQGIQAPTDRDLASLPKLMEITAVPGVAMGVLQAGKLSWEKYEGAADKATGRPVTADTLFPAASLSKPVFAFAVLQLVDEKRLDLDRPLKSYLPDHAPDDARGDKVTARHVLSHSTGFRNWRNSAEQRLIPDFDPGARFQYSGEGFFYLQRVVEQIAGVPFERFMEERVFGPLSMRSSTYAWRADTDARLVAGHNRGTPVRGSSRDFAQRLHQHAQELGKPLGALTYAEIVAAMGAIRPAPPALPNFMLPNAAASLLTTVGDYARFLARLLDPSAGEPALKPATRSIMFAPQATINSALAWGLGWGLESNRGESYIWHWGDNGNFKNFVLAHLPSRSAILVLTNGNQGMRVAEAVVEAAAGGDLFAFEWL